MYFLIPLASVCIEAIAACIVAAVLALLHEREPQ